MKAAISMVSAKNKGEGEKRNPPQPPMDDEGGQQAQGNEELFLN